ncbi:hypothetical protein PSHT_07177 [Puccinia striiformis]|nr:hypothetical protein PSHT_07177 [Puccinia striiformis]
MRFTYVVAGWEGCAHDAIVLHHARTKDFTIPSGSFYLGDAGYGLAHGVLTCQPQGTFQPSTHNTPKCARSGVCTSGHLQLFNRSLQDIGRSFFDWDESTQSTGEDAGNEEPPEDQPVQISCRQKKLLAKWRDDIAQALWEQNQGHLASHPLGPQPRDVGLLVGRHEILSLC